MFRELSKLATERDEPTKTRRSCRDLSARSMVGAEAQDAGEIVLILIIATYYSHLFTRQLSALLCLLVAARMQMLPCTMWLV